MAASGSILGNAVQRKEDPGLLTGANKYLDDLDVDAAHIVFVRSTMAHAAIEGIDTSEAEGMPGVLGVYTADNLEMATVNGFPDLGDHMNRPPLAVGRVRFVGDIVAAEMIVVYYDPRPAITDFAVAAAADSPVIWETMDNNVCFAITNEYDGPDVLEGADAVVSERIVTQRLAGVPMEPNGCLAIPEGDSMTFYASTQAAHSLKAGLAPNLGYDDDHLRVIAPWVGGGFGPKAAFYV